MKKSLFTIDRESSDGRYYILHTDSGNVIAVNNAKKRHLKELLNHPNNYIGEEALNSLCALGFIIPDDRDEYQLITGKKLLRSFKNNYLELIIMPTEKCNFRCVYCYENFMKPKMSEEIQEAIINLVKRELPYHKGLSVSWFGGEPLLAIDVIERLSTTFIELCKQFKKPYRSSMTTNGYLLNRELFNKLTSFRVNHFQITIDGDRRTHDKQRMLAGGGPTYDVILDNLNDIKLNARGRLWTVSLRTNVTKDVINNIDKFQAEITRPFGNDRRFYIMLRQMWTNNTSTADSILCSDDEFERFVEECDISENSLYQEYVFSYDLNFACYASNPNSLVIGSDGAVYKCTYALYDEINHVGEVDAAGNIRIDENKMCYWIAPRASDRAECVSCHEYAACAACGCPYKQNKPCKQGTLDMLKYYLPKFYQIAQKKLDLSALL